MAYSDPKPKRTFYEPQVYTRLTAELTRLMIDVPKLKPDRDAWDIEGDWGPTGNVYFIDARYMSDFHHYRDFDCRTIKLVNYDRPAVKLTFFKKHRYWLIKDAGMALTEKAERIKEYIGQVLVRVAITDRQADKAAGPAKTRLLGEAGELRREIDTWQLILDELQNDPLGYELAVSNYNRFHCYVTLNYKYQDVVRDFANGQEHLLNHQRDKENNIHQVRHNLIFVDADHIYREHPHQHKEVDLFLERFERKALIGRNQLFARQRGPIEREGLEALLPSPLPDQALTDPPITLDTPTEEKPTPARAKTKKRQPPTARPTLFDE